MSNEENLDCRQDKENQIRPIELLVNQSCGKEVSEHDDEDDAGDDVHQDLESHQVVAFVGKGVQIGVDSAKDVKLK